MVRQSHQQPPVAEWLQAFKIEISSSSGGLFGNGLQQAEITLSVEPRSGQVITPTQFDSLIIVVQRADGQYDPLPIDQVGTPPWFARTVRDERFEFFPGRALPQSTNAPPSNALMSKFFYVSSSAPGGASIRLRARILKDAQTEYITDDTFDFLIVLVCESLPSYVYPDDYAWTLSHQEGVFPGGRFIQEWSLSARHARFSFAQVQGNLPHGMIRWQRNTAGETLASNVGVALPGNAAVQYNPAIRLGDAFPVRQHQQIRSANPNQVVVVLQGDNQIPYYSEGLDHQGPCQLTAYDVYGNVHAIGILFDNSQSDPTGRRTTLQVTTRSPAVGSDAQPQGNAAIRGAETSK